MRIDVIHPPVPDLGAWRAAAEEACARGFTALLCPDVPGAVDPFAALAAAATAAPGLRVGTHVLAATLRTPAEGADALAELEAAAPGRVDVGLGTGRPQTRAGGPTAAALRERVRDLAARVRDLAPGAAVTVAGSGPRTLALAGVVADEVSLAAPPDAGGDAYAAARTAVGDPDVGLALTLAAAGDRVPAFHAGRVTADGLRRAAAYAVLPADPADARATLARWTADGVRRLVVDHSLRDAVQLVLDDPGTAPASPGRQAVPSA